MRGLVTGVGSLGINRDVLPGLLPKGVWSNGRNVRFDANKVKEMGGVQHVTDIVEEDINWVGFANGVNNRYYVYSDGNKVWAWNGTTTSDITRTSGGDYNSTLDFVWRLEMYNGFMLLNNGTDLPQQWNPNDILNNMFNLSNWDATWRAKRIVPFGALLVALNTTENSVPFPHRIRWSNPADPGAVPADWDETDPTNLAGMTSLSDTGNGEIQDAMMLGQDLMIYKEQSVWQMQLTGDPNQLFDLQMRHEGIGLFIPRSLARVIHPQTKTEYHFIASEDNFYLVNAHSRDPVFSEVFRDEYLKLVDDTYYHRAFTVKNSKHNELWYCFPEQGSEVATLAFVWNYKNNTYNIKELSGTNSIAQGISFQTQGETIEVDQAYTDNTLHNDDSGYWDEREVKSRLTMLEASILQNKVYYLEQGDLGYDGTMQICYVERTELADLSDEKADYFVRKILQGVIPKIYEGGAGLLVGAQESRGSPVVWAQAEDVGPMTNLARPSIPVSGRLLAFRFYKVQDQPFAVGGFDYELQTLGRF